MSFAPNDAVAQPVGFRTWRVIDGELASPYVPVRWEGGVLIGDCYRDLPTPFRSTSRYLDAPHSVPHADCGCGVHATFEPRLDFPTIDYRGVTGIVALWGRVVVEPDGIRAQYARAAALGMYSRWSPRQRRAVREVARRAGIDVVPLEELRAAALDYGAPLAVPAGGAVEELAVPVLEPSESVVETVTADAPRQPRWR